MKVLVTSEFFKYHIYEFGNIFHNSIERSNGDPISLLDFIVKIFLYLNYQKVGNPEKGGKVASLL